MSHEIIEGVDGFLSNGYESVWHQAGIRIHDEHVTAENAFELAGLTERVTLESIQTMSGIPVDAKAIIRKGISHGVVKGNRYKPIHDIDLSKEAQFYVDNGFMIETCGSLRMGKDVFVTMNPHLESEVSEGDSIKGYFNILNCNDGKTALRAGLSITRIVCANTQAMALSEGGFLSLSHNDTALDKLKQFRELMINMKEDFNVTLKKLQSLKTKRVSSKEVQEFFTHAMKLKESTHAQNTLNKLMELFHNGKGNEGKTYYDGYNAITEYYTHYSNANAEKRLVASIDGVANDNMNKALKLALAA